MENENKEMSFNARQVIAILEQAEVGCHALFDSPTIRRALTTSRVSEMEMMGSSVKHVQRAIGALAEMESVNNQRDYIQGLPLEVQNLLVHLYFRFLDQFMQRREITLH